MASFVSTVVALIFVMRLSEANGNLFSQNRLNYSFKCDQVKRNAAHTYCKK